MGTHEGPDAVGLNALHEKVRDPHCVEKVSRTKLLRTRVLSQVQKLKDVRVPGLEVDGKGARAFVASLVHVAGRVVVDAQHRDEAIADAVCAANVGTSGADAVHVDANATGRLGDDGALLERVIDALN